MSLIPTIRLKIANSSYYLKVKLGERVLITELRKAVLALRAAKGMLLDEKDKNSWSAGSFFVNPILDAKII